MSKLLGIPFSSDGYHLASARFDRPDRLVLGYDTTDGEGHVKVVVLPAASLERQVVRLRHVALFYEAELPSRSLDRRGKAAELLHLVGTSVDDWLAREPDLAFPAGLTGCGTAEEYTFDAHGMRLLLSDLASPQLPKGSGVYDAFPTDGSVVIEFGSGESNCRVLLTITPGRSERAMLRTDKLSISMQTLGSEVGESRLELTALAELSALVIVSREDQIVFDGVTADSLWPDPWSPANKPPAAKADDDDRLRQELALLEPTLRAASDYFGSECYAEYFEAACPALRVEFARIPARLATGPTYFLAAPESIRRRRALAEYLRALGYFFDDAGIARTVPTPESLSRALRERGVIGTGFRPRLLVVDDYRVDPVNWLDLYLEGSIGINVGSAQFYARHAKRLALRTPNRFWCEHLTAVGHDMSVHVLLTHRIPFAQIAELGALGQPMLRRCRAEDRDDALLPLVEMYEEDLPQICREIWERLSTPEDFERAFSQRRDELLTRMRQRIAECEAALAAPDNSRLSNWKERAELSLALVRDVWRAARSGLGGTSWGPP